MLKKILLLKGGGGVGVKTEPSPEDFEFKASAGLRYAGWEPRYTGSTGSQSDYGGTDNFLIPEGLNLTGSCGVRAT